MDADTSLHKLKKVAIDKKEERREDMEKKVVS